MYKVAWMEHQWVNVYEFDGGNSYNSSSECVCEQPILPILACQNGAGAVVGLASLQFYGK